MENWRLKPSDESFILFPVLAHHFNPAEYMRSRFFYGVGCFFRFANNFWPRLIFGSIFYEKEEEEQTE